MPKVQPSLFLWCTPWCCSWQQPTDHRMWCWIRRLQWWWGCERVWWNRFLTLHLAGCYSHYQIRWVWNWQRNGWYWHLWPPKIFELANKERIELTEKHQERIRRLHCSWCWLHDHGHKVLSHPRVVLATMQQTLILDSCSRCLVAVNVTSTLAETMDVGFLKKPISFFTSDNWDAVNKIWQFDHSCWRLAFLDNHHGISVLSCLLFLLIQLRIRFLLKGLCIIFLQL